MNATTPDDLHQCHVWLTQAGAVVALLVDLSALSDGNSQEVGRERAATFMDSAELARAHLSKAAAVLRAAPARGPLSTADDQTRYALALLRVLDLTLWSFAADGATTEPDYPGRVHPLLTLVLAQVDEAAAALGAHLSAPQAATEGREATA